MHCKIPAHKHRSTSRPAAPCWLWTALVILAMPFAAWGEDDAYTRRYFEGLRDRQLFEIAERFAREQLARDDLLPEERLQYSVELANTLAEHAVRATDVKQQSELWAEARRTLDQAIEQQPAQKLSLKYHQAQLDVSHGQSLRYQSELVPHDQVVRGRAATVLQRAVEQLRELKAAAAQAGQAVGDSRPLPPAELDELVLLAKQQEAIALVELGTVLARDSPDRALALVEAAKLLKELPAATGAAARKRTSENLLLYARCLRLQGHHPQALEVLNQFSTSGSLSAIGDRAAAERVRVLIAMGRPDDAAKLLDEFAIAGRELPAELAFLNVRILSTQWEKTLAAGEDQQAAGLLELIRQQAEKVEKQFGGYWGARARNLSEFDREAAQMGPELALTIRSARSLYGHGKVLDAISEYGKAAGAAFAAGKRDLAFDLAFTRGSLQLRAKQYDVAAGAFGELMSRFPDNPRAAEASLLHAYALGQLYNTRRTKSRREEYTRAIEEHREKFPDHPTAASATWMLAQLEEQRLQTSVALRLYQSIPADHPRGPAAQLAVARCYEKILTRLRSLNRPTDEWRETAVAELQGYLPPPSAQRPSFTESQAAIVTYLARMHLNAAPPDFSAADTVLARLFEAYPPEATRGASPQLRRTLTEAMQLRVVSLAGQNRMDEAGGILSELSETSPSDMLQILNGLSRLVHTAGEDVRKGLGVLQLQAVENLQRRRGELNEQQAKRLDACRAQAYVATGRLDEAIALYEELTKQFPKDGDLQSGLGEVLIDCGTRKCLKQAQQIWRRIEAAHKSGTPTWLNARYYRALAAYELEEDENCHKLLGIAMQLYPELGGPELKARYTALAEQCAARRKKGGTQ